MAGSALGTFMDFAKNCAQAQFYLGYMYIKGEGVDIKCNRSL